MERLNIVTQPYGIVIVNAPLKEAQKMIDMGRATIATDADVSAATAQGTLADYNTPAP